MDAIHLIHGILPACDIRRLMTEAHQKMGETLASADLNVRQGFPSLSKRES